MLSAVVELVADLNTAPAGLDPLFQNHTQMNGVAYFSLATSDFGEELWKSDGTPEGTLRVTDLLPGPTGSSIRNLTPFNGEVYFTGYSAVEGTAMWHSDGTAEGTSIFAPSAYRPKPLVVSGNSLYFSAGFPQHSELWVTDGTDFGTRMLFDMATLSQFQSITDAALVNGMIYFQTSVDNGYTDLWVTDGTVDGTSLLLENSLSWILNRDNPASRVVGNNFFFVHEDEQYGRELWVTKGTSASTHIVKDMIPGSGSSYPSGLEVVGDHLYFNADTVGLYQSIWSTDGTDVGTIQMAEVVGAVGDTTIIDGKYFFVAHEQLWSSDGTQSGTAAVFGGWPGVRIQRWEEIAGKLYIVAIDQDHGGEVWVSDGTASGTHLIRDVHPGAGDSVLFPTIIPAGERAIWVANDGIHGLELWASEANGADAHLLADIETGTESSVPVNLTELNGDVYLHATSGSMYTSSSEFNLYKIPASGSSPEKIEGIVNQFGIQNINDHLFMMGFDQSHGSELWTLSNGVPEFFVDAAPGADGGSLMPLFRFGSAWYFFAEGSLPSLWKTDGTPAGTSQVTSFPARQFNRSRFPSVGPEKFYFVTGDVSTGFQLWQSDGTSTGTTVLSENLPTNFTFPPELRTIREDTIVYTSAGFMYIVNAASGSVSNISESPTGTELQAQGVVLLDNSLVFLADERTTGNRALWVASITGSEKRSIQSFARERDFGIFQLLNGGLVFVGDQSLWSLPSPNTEPIRLAEFYSDAGPLEFLPGNTIDGKLFFSTRDTLGNSQIWVTDGTAEGTVRIPTSFASPLRFVGADFVKYGNGIAFTANLPEIGTELFRIDTTIAVTMPTDLTIDQHGEGVDVTWPDVAGAIQYDVWMQNLSEPSAPVIRKRINDSRLTLLDDTGYVIANDLSSSAYRVWVRSLPVLGEPSAWSAPKDFVLGPNPVMQAMPAVSINAIPTFRWTGPQDVVSYELWLSNRDAKTRPIYRTGLQSTSFAVTDPLPPAKYAVWVRGTRADGTTTNWSDLTEFEILVPPVQLTSGKGDSRIPRPTFAWAAVTDATGYDVRVFESGTTTLIDSANNVHGLTHTPLQDLPAGKFTVYVRALKGTRPLSAWGNGDALWLKLPPLNLRSTATGVAWDAVPFAVSYTFELRDSRGALAVPRKSQTGTTFDPATPLTPGQYSLRVFTNFSNLSSNWSATYAFELFRPPVAITSSGAATVDATPTITWTTAPGAATYEVVVTKSGSPVPVYARTGITTTSHRIEIPLGNGIHEIQVRAIFADGSRSSWSPVQQLFIGPAATLTYAAGKLSWSSVNAATNYELWINYLGAPSQSKIVYQPLYAGTSYTLPSTLPKGRYQTWLRAIRAENGQLYAGAWTSVLFDVV